MVVRATHSVLMAKHSDNYRGLFKQTICMYVFCSYNVTLSNIILCVENEILLGLSLCIITTKTKKYIMIMLNKAYGSNVHRHVHEI